MMDGAYFTSRNDILTFLNTLLDLNLTKIEQTASGAVACQLMEYVFPNSIIMSRVNWAAKASHEYIANYKLLQGAFTKANIQKYIDVDKLIRGKYQDNLEFCQWLKAFFDQTSPMMGGGGRREGYDPVAVRARGKGGKAVPTGNRGGGAKKATAASSSSVTARPVRAMGGTTAVAPKRSAVASVSKDNAPPRPGSGGSSVSSVTRASSASGQKENAANASNPDPSSSRAEVLPAASNPRKPASSSNTSAAAARHEAEIRALKAENAALDAKYAELERATAEIELTLQTVESERDFYFEKLRGIEVMLQVYKEREEENEGSGDVSRVMDKIFKVMYATMEDDVVVDDEGNVS